MTMVAKGRRRKKDTGPLWGQAKRFLEKRPRGAATTFKKTQRATFRDG